MNKDSNDSNYRTVYFVPDSNFDAGLLACTASMQSLTYLKFSDLFNEENKESVKVFYSKEPKSVTSFN